MIIIKILTKISNFLFFYKINKIKIENIIKNII